MKTSYALLILILLVASCSDLKKGSGGKSSAPSVTRFNVGCTISIKEFEKILEKDVSNQIKCLGKSLNLFVDVVRSERAGYLSRTAFEQYVTTNVPDFDPENIKMIKSIFDISHLVLGEDRNFISKTAINEIIEFLYVFNREFSKIYPLIQSREQVAYSLHDLQRVRVYKAADTISHSLLELLKINRGGAIHGLDIVDIIESFTSDDNAETMDKVKALLFVKKVVLGGKNDYITHIELQDALHKLSSAARVVFDLARYKYVSFDYNNQNSQKNLIEFFSNDLDEIEKMLYHPATSGEKLFTIDDVTNAIPYFLDADSDFPDLKKYRKEVLQVKLLATTTTAWSANENVTGKEVIYPSDLRAILDHARALTSKGLIFHRIYDFFKDKLNTPGPVTINYNNYLLQFPTHEAAVKDFARIVSKYRFFWGKSELPYYTSAQVRNVDGVVEVSIMEYALKLMARRYGKAQANAVGGYVMDQEMLLNVFKIFDKILVDEEIIRPNRSEKTNENITLLSTLFQNQSNGDEFIEVNELAEFAIQVFSVMKDSDWLASSLADHCRTDERNRITDLKCYRENFFPVLCQKYQANFPKLFEVLGIKTCRDAGDRPLQAKYLELVENLGRTCTVFKDGTDVPLDKDDYLPIMTMVMDIEGTMLRYDKNGNNKMDPSELVTAYDETFNVAIKALVKEQAPIIAKLPFNLGSGVSRKIFYFLIKNRRQPKKFWDYFKLLTIGPTTTNRDTIAAVLKIISEQGVASDFDCETLR